MMAPTIVGISLVEPPLIAECPINLECIAVGMEEIGDDGRIQVERLGVFCFMQGFAFGG